MIRRCLRVVEREAFYTVDGFGEDSVAVGYFDKPLGHQRVVGKFAKNCPPIFVGHFSVKPNTEVYALENLIARAWRQGTISELTEELANDSKEMV